MRRNPELRLDDSIELSISVNQFNTLQQSNKIFIRSPASRSKSRTPRQGLMQKTIMERIEQYKTADRLKRMDVERIYQLQEQENRLKFMKQKPDINGKSQKLFHKRKRERSLSPNVLDRFENYEKQKAKDKIMNTIGRILEVTPNKRITQKDINSFATPKEVKYLKELFNLKPE